jgi:hypothetical protein
VLVVDSAHHVLPAKLEQELADFPQKLNGVVLVSDTPGLLAKPVLRAVDTIIVVGDQPRDALTELAPARLIQLSA